MAHLPPDILLSIGSGHCGKLKGPRRPLRTARKTGIGSHVKAFYRIAVDHIESSLDSQKAWRDYLALVSPEKDQRWRYRRLNVELDEAPPKLDDVDSMPELQLTARHRWTLDEECYTSIAQQLVASSFFFEMDRLETQEDESIVCSGNFRTASPNPPADTPLGTIHCRFIQGSQHIRELGAYLQRCQVGNHSSYFVIQERYRECLAQQVPIPQDVIDNMRYSGSFVMKLKFTTSGQLFPTDVLLCLDRRDTWFSISGFPRLLQNEDGPRGANYLFPCSVQCQAANFRIVMRKLGGMSNRWRTPSQMHRRGNWPGPQSSDLHDRDHDTISNYSNPDYIVGKSTPAALDMLSAQFQQSTLDLNASGRFELDAGCEIERYELPDTSLGIPELPARTWPDHLTQHAEPDESSNDYDEVSRNSWN